MSEYQIMDCEKNFYRPQEDCKNEFDRSLIESHNLYFSLFNSIRDAILVADTDRNIIDLNRAFTKVFGYTKEDLRDKKTVFVYENEQQYTQLRKTLINNLGKTRDFLFTVNYRKKSGEVFPGETGVYYLPGPGWSHYWIYWAHSRCI